MLEWIEVFHPVNVCLIVFEYARVHLSVLDYFVMYFDRLSLYGLACWCVFANVRMYLNTCSRSQLHY